MTTRPLQHCGLFLKEVKYSKTLNSWVRLGDLSKHREYIGCMTEGLLLLLFFSSVRVISLCVLDSRGD